MKEINMIIGKNIRFHREKAGYTREHLAALIDVSPRFLADAERGSVGISITTLKKICTALAVKSDDIIWENSVSKKLDDKSIQIDRKYLPFIEELIRKQIEIINMAENNCLKGE